jgi:hypothetical protein
MEQKMHFTKFKFLFAQGMTGPPGNPGKDGADGTNGAPGLQVKTTYITVVIIEHH